ncbi:thioredoxin domain-containing protein 11 [Trichonephila inaurata madagascariensis]|uniref:Thioredoxin domain-containing protein 11 n=1 Tax=Trichonephila inaurata madagascariensis TaxID=2747483 RepID=A0A8X6YL12_9ARAC|nr:thioredoxin domain-containing protein 11 [Trichonephila inaurata madagascariensis]
MAATNDLIKDEDDTDIKIQDTRGDPLSLTKYFQVMNSYGREIFFVITIVFTGIAALQSGPLKTKKVNPPDIFFEPPSLVTDFYNGNIKQLLSLISEKDVSLVMYYAPWDASSLQAREEFETVAKFYHNEVFFAAINCWWPEGECRKKFSVPSYPIILSYVHEMGIVRYEGPIVSTYLIYFLDSILSPVVPLHHTGELFDLLTKHEAVLVAYFEFKNGSYPKGYKQFYFAALKALSNDPHRRICFAVLTNKQVAENFRLRSSVQLFLWNTSQVYREEIRGHMELLKWAYGVLDYTSDWVSPPGTKSSMLSEIFEDTAALVLFTPRSLLLEYTPYYNLLKEIALDYNNCNKSSFVESIKHRMVLKRHIMQEELSKTIKKCHKKDTPNDPDVCRFHPDLCDLTCCQSTSLKLKLNQACSCRACLHHIVENIEEMKLFECENTLKLVLKNFDINELGSFDKCNDIEVSFPVKFGRYKQLSFHCQNESPYAFKSSKKQLTEEEIAELKDDLILTMIQNNEKRLCYRMRYALNSSEVYFPSFPDPSDTTTWLNNFTGIGCLTNRTLNFIAMDVNLYHSFAENLGIDVSKSHHQTSAVIIETSKETQFVLEEPVTKKALVEFIKNYTSGSLNRFLRMPVRKLGNCNNNGEEDNVCVEEATTATFFDVILDDKDVVLLYYASWCGVCHSISHIFLSVADYFAKVEDIKFVRINGEENDLPWEYTVEKYPTIIFFPVKRKSDSVEFPAHLQISMTNLLHFVLVHTQPKVRWKVSMEMCNRECIAHNLIMSSKELRRLFREHKSLINDLHIAQLIIYRPKKVKLQSKQKGSKGPNVNYLKSVYLKYVIKRIHKKRRQIYQAQQLQIVLRKKMDIYLQDVKKSSSDKKGVASGRKSKHLNFRQKNVKDEL